MIPDNRHNHNNRQKPHPIFPFLHHISILPAIYLLSVIPGPRLNDDTLPSSLLLYLPHLLPDCHSTDLLHISSPPVFPSPPPSSYLTARL